MNENDINKTVAKYESKIFGGTPTIMEYTDASGKLQINLYESSNVPEKGVQTCATIGLNATNIGLVSMGKKLRVEIVGAIDSAVENYGYIIASLAFDVMDSKRCRPGYVIEDILPEFVPDSEMKHIMLTDPFVWEDLENISIDDRWVAWLMAVPISESECEYARKNGTEALEALLEENDADIWDIYRESVI